MATVEEQQELVEALKGPHYYRITVNGYGGETAYIKISKAAKEFWEKHTEDGDGDLISYCINASDYTAEQFRQGDTDIEWNSVESSELTDEVMFLHDPADPEAVGSGWYESSNEQEHTYAVNADSAAVYIEKVESDDYMAKHIEDVVNGESISDLVNRVGEETDWSVELQEGLENTVYMTKGDFICQMHSSEKGCFFETIVQTDTLFDLKKLRFIVDEAPNGEDVLFGITYNGEDLDNGGGDTNGKGYYAWVWEQEF